MIFGIVGLVFLIIAIVLFFLDDEADVALLISGCSVLVFFAIIIWGVLTYPNLLAEKIRLETLKSKIELVSDIRLDKTENNSNMVAGSIDNINASTTYGQYIIEYAKGVAEYNKNLTNIKMKKHMFIVKFFGGAVFYSSKIDELELMN
jgi:hypothetical protein